MAKSCFNCNSKKAKKFQGYNICDSCKSKLGLFTDETIKKYVNVYKKTKNKSFTEEIKRRLDVVEKDYTKKKIKLKYVLERLKKL